MKLFFLLLLFCQAASAGNLDSLARLPIQDSGRVKPLDTFARETVSLIYGKEKLEGRDPLEVLMTWILQPQAWQDKRFVEVKYQLLKRALKLDESQNRFTLQEILSSERLSYVMQELQSKREMKAKLDPYFQSLQRLEMQIGMFRGIASGELIRLVPPKDGSLWLSILDLNAEQKQSFRQITRAFIAHLEDAPSAASEMQAAVNGFIDLARAGHPEVYPAMEKINAEVHYHKLHPFQKAWIIYLLSCLCFLLIWVTKNQIFYRLAWGFSGLGLAFHLYGFILRVYLTGRPPVSNMYETVVWVALGALLFSMIIEAIYRWRFSLLAGVTVAGFCLMLADFSPLILDPSLQPLEAVLNSNFWLTTHVLTITVSYAAFFLAFALGDISLFYFLRAESDNSVKIKALTLSIYRAIQIGVSCLAPGIILGGIWADYSWGRFWGWDPKETWALIALLGYLAVLHARLSGLLQSFGMAAASVLAFSLVIMAWYGVNFVLGAGLHSYGFGAGGVEYVASFVALHIVFVAMVAQIRSLRMKNARRASR
jgi:cytochrome c-type biogenesis protein CcsB